MFVVSLPLGLMLIFVQGRDMNRSKFYKILVKIVVRPVLQEFRRRIIRQRFGEVAV